MCLRRKKKSIDHLRKKLGEQKHLAACRIAQISAPIRSFPSIRRNKKKRHAPEGDEELLSELILAPQQFPMARPPPRHPPPPRSPELADEQRQQQDRLTSSSIRAQIRKLARFGAALRERETGIEARKRRPLEEGIDPDPSPLLSFLPRRPRP